MSRRNDGAGAELETKKGTAPVSPSPTLASAGARPQGPSVSNSICDGYTTALATVQDAQALSEKMVEKIHREMSHARMSRYMVIADGDKRLALGLHAWNAAVAASLIPGLQVAEVTIRNIAVHRIISRYQKAWFDHPDFIRKLGTGENTENLKLAVDARKKVTTEASQVSNYILRDLNFGFWVNVFSKRFRDELWNRDLWTYLPNVSRGRTIMELHKEIDSIRDFRNEVAHHKNIVTKLSPRTPPERFNAFMHTLAELSPDVEIYAKLTCLFPSVWAACPMPAADFTAGVQRLRECIK